MKTLVQTEYGRDHLLVGCVHTLALPGSPLSTSVTAWPARWRARAVAVPTMPAPMTMTDVLLMGRG